MPLKFKLYDCRRAHKYLWSQNSFFLRQGFAIGRKESFKTIISNATLYDFLNFKIRQIAANYVLAVSQPCILMMFQWHEFDDSR